MTKVKSPFVTAVHATSQVSLLGAEEGRGVGSQLLVLVRGWSGVYLALLYDRAPRGRN